VGQERSAAVDDIKKSAVDAAGTLQKMLEGATLPQVLLNNIGQLVVAEVGHLAKQVKEAYVAGFDQIQIDLKDLGYTVGVSYPLLHNIVERLRAGPNGQGMTFPTKFDVLWNVVWDPTDRFDELRRVATTAFGSLGPFILFQAQTRDSQPGPSA
jgi:hypothetical protein